MNLLYVGVGNQGAAVTHSSPVIKTSVSHPRHLNFRDLPSSYMNRKSNKHNLCMNFPFSSVVCSSDLETSSIKSDVRTISLLLLRQETASKQTVGENINSSHYAFLLEMTTLRI